MMTADKLFEWDRTSFATGAKNWLSKQGNEWLGTPDALARHNVRLAANKLYKTWRMYLQQNASGRVLTGTNVELADFISQNYGADKLPTLNNLVPNILPQQQPAPVQAASAQPAAAAQPAASAQPAQATQQRQRTRRRPPSPPMQPQSEGRQNRRGRLIEANPAQAAQAPAQPAQPTQPAPQAQQTPQPAPAGVFIPTRFQVDKLFVALGRIMLASGEARPYNTADRRGHGDYDSGNYNNNGAGGGYRGVQSGGQQSAGQRSPLAGSKVLNTRITPEGYEKALRRVRGGDPGEQRQIFKILHRQSAATIDEITKEMGDVSYGALQALLTAVDFS